MMQAGYAADDLQYGFKGIANNIQPILQSIPALASLAGPISIAAIAVYQLYEHWDQIQGLLGMGIPQPALKGPELLAANLKKATEEMEALQKKTTLAWWEITKLGELKIDIARMTKDQEAQSAVDSASKGTSEAEKAVGGGFAKAMAESGGKNAQDELLNRLKDTKDGKGLVYNEAKGRMDTPENAARDMSAAALGGDKISRDAIAKLLENGSRFKANISKFSPEQAQADKDRAAEKKGEDDAILESEREAKAEAAEKKRVQAHKDAKTAKNQEVDDAVDEIQRDLFKQDAKDSKDLAKHTKDAGDAQFELMTDAMKEPDRRKSSVIGGVEWAKSIQSAVGAPDKTLEMIQQQKRTNDLLEKLANARAGAAALQFGGNGALEAR
jgi:hypothetical protein